jgi:hypothetical protein
MRNERWSNSSRVKKQNTQSTYLEGGFIMKRILIIFCLIALIAILPAPLFAEDFTFKTIRFFEGGYEPPEDSQRNFTVQFPKSSTRYVWCQIDVENSLYNVREQNHKVTWRYYNPDETLRGETNTDFQIKREWYTAWIPSGWGWDEAGNWPVGTYRVEVWIDGKKSAQDLFIIYDDRAVTSTSERPEEKTYLEFESVKFFEGGSTDVPESQRQYKNDFPRSNTRFVYFLVSTKNLLYRNRRHKPLVYGRYYFPDGSFMGEAEINVDIPPDWGEAELWNAWGWDAPGNWSLGTYRVEIIFGNTKVGEGKFTIYDDQASKPPPVVSDLGEKTYLEFKSVKFFEGGYTAPPESQRQFKMIFPKSSTRYVFYLVEAKNLLYGNRVHKPLVVGRFYNPDGTVRGEGKVNVDISPDWESTVLWSGWGADEPGTWPVGTYRVEIWFGNQKVGEDRFSIYDDKK